MENKFLVFCRHRAVMTALEQVLTTKHVQYIRIAGDVPSSVRGVRTPFSAIFSYTYHEKESALSVTEK